MRKMYNQPEVLVSEMEPQTVLCASITAGEDVPNPTDENVMYGD